MATLTTTPATNQTQTPDPPADRQANPAAGPSLLVDIRELSALLSRSAGSLERDQAAGRLPAPIYVGGSRRWRREEIEAWVAAGCPDRKTWDAIRAARN
jgi:predicted DNA-binding transcriptional regulator AlpA